MSVPAACEGPRTDGNSAQWLAGLGQSGPGRDHAVGGLHQMLLRVARAELRRRGAGQLVTGPELDDLAHQAADDAVMAIMAKLGQFRGESRFTTWACKFVILEVSAKLGRHFWRRPAAILDEDGWERLPDRFALRPDEQAQQRDLVAAVRRAVEQELTTRQRQVFMAIVVDGIPLDALAAQLGSNRNAIYKTMFDARRKLRAVLAANGYLSPSGQAGSGGTGTVRRS
jgi:RNA polymerase sigma-70 factor, ECF subfamily